MCLLSQFWVWVFCSKPLRDAQKSGHLFNGLHKPLSSLMKNTEDLRARSRHWVLDKVICLHCDSRERHRGRQGQGRKREWGFNTVLPLVTLVSSTLAIQIWSEFMWTKVLSKLNSTGLQKTFIYWSTATLTELKDIHISSYISKGNTHLGNTMLC